MELDFKKKSSCLDIMNSTTTILYPCYSSISYAQHDSAVFLCVLLYAPQHHGTKICRTVLLHFKSRDVKGCQVGLMGNLLLT